MSSMSIKRGFEAGLPRGVLEIGERAGILGVFGGSGQMKVAALAELLPRLDQALMDRVELVGVRRDDAPLDRLFQPGPLKHRRLEDRGRRVGVVFQQFRRSLSVEAEVEPAIEAGLVAVPAVRDQRPERFRYLQAAQIFLVVDREADEFEAHGVDLGRRQLDLALDFVEREGVVAAFVPITLAVDGVKIKPGLVGGNAPVVALGAGEALHGRPLAAAMGVAAMSMKMPVEPMHPAAEAAIGHAAIAPAIRIVDQRVTGAAISARHKTHRHRADGSCPHHGQNDAARAFHGEAPVLFQDCSEADPLSFGGGEASGSEPLQIIVRRNNPEREWFSEARLIGARTANSDWSVFAKPGPNSDIGAD